MSKKRKILLFIIGLLLIGTLVLLGSYLLHRSEIINSYKCANATKCDCSDGMERCKCFYLKEDKTISNTTIICNRDLGVYKPVLYLYPKDNIDVKVTFSHPEYLTTTYPKYFDKWEVRTNKDGSLYDKDGKYYYALYWEEKNKLESDFKEGFYVTKETAISFLEDKLSAIGLNDRERNEFIMYWLPILEKNENSLVQFKLTDELQDYNKVIIEPETDSLLRVKMYVKKVDKEENIKEQRFDTFERKGFTAVEWGGVILE